MECTDALKALCMETARSLKGSARRLFMARTVKALGPGGQRRAERELGWSRVTIRKGPHEVERGFTCLEAFAARGRKPVEAHLLTLLPESTALVESPSQTDPQCRTQRLSTRLSAAEVRRQLSAQQGYLADELPTVQTITTTLNPLGYSPKKVAKSPPPKKSPKPTRSSTKGIRSIRPRMQQTTSDASPWMPRRRSRSVLLPVVASVAWRWPPLSTTVPPRRP